MLSEKNYIAEAISASGEKFVFQKPENRGDVELSWTIQEHNGVYGCFVSGKCNGGFGGSRAIALHPVGVDPHLEYMAIESNSEYWCMPTFGNDLGKIGSGVRLQSLLINDNGLYRYYLPVCDSIYKSYISGADGCFEIRMMSNCGFIDSCDGQLAFVYGENKDPYVLMRDCARAVADLLDNGLKMREEREFPEVLEYLGWCSWDALQIRVSHEGLIEKSAEFKNKKIPVHYAMIDDMWADCPHLNEIPDGIPFARMVQHMHGTKMRSFEGDPVRFPKGMRSAIDDLRAAGIPKVGIWFPTTGYWFGWSEEGEAANIKPLLDYGSGGRLIVKPTEEAACAYFERLCEKAREWGADLVKIDNQAFHRINYADISPVGHAARLIHGAIDEAVKRFFNGAIINCMGMANECMFNRPTTAVCRCSDDFIPDDKEWFAKNILECAYNGTLQGQYYVNDWDMWWTQDEQAKKNSLCRAISGGPIYVSDKIGRTDGKILEPIMLSSGRILRPDNSAVPSKDCLTADPTRSGKAFKICNRVGKSGVVALFNIDAENRTVEGRITADDVGLDAGDYAYYEYFSGEAGVLSNGGAIEVSLKDNDEFRMYTLVPYDPSGIAFVGRIDKFIGIKAVTSVTEGYFEVLEGGKIGVISEKDVIFTVDDKALAATRYGIKYTVECDEDVRRIYYSFV